MLSPSSYSDDYLVFLKCNNNFPRNIITINRSKKLKGHFRLQNYTTCIQERTRVHQLYMYFFNLSFVRFFQYDLLQKDRNFSVSLFLACYVQLDLQFTSRGLNIFCIKDHPFLLNFSFTFERRFFKDLPKHVCPDFTGSQEGLFNSFKISFDIDSILLPYNLVKGRNRRGKEVGGFPLQFTDRD